MIKGAVRFWVRLGAAFLAAGLLAAGCATGGAASPGTADGEVPWEADVSGGDNEIRLDYSGFEKNGIPLRDIHTVWVGAMDRDSGRELWSMRWQDESWHSGHGSGEEPPRAVWETSDLPVEPVDVKIWVDWDTYEGEYSRGGLVLGPIPWNREEGNAETLEVELRPFQGAGKVKMTAVNETGIGTMHGEGLGVYLHAEDSGTRYHYHLPPGQEYLTYEKTKEGIQPGDYQFSVHAWKDGNWAYYGNAVWEGELTVRAGETVDLTGELAVKTAPWDLGLTLEDFQPEGEKSLYETELDETDPRMGKIRQHRDRGVSRLEGGKIQVSGEGDISGGVDFQVTTGENHLVRFRAMVPEGGGFFVNTHVWGDSRMAIIFNPRREDRKPSLYTFSWKDHQDIPGASRDARIPELNPGQWYDYTLVDSGEKLFVLIDNALVQVFDVPEELPKKGELNLEWHKPCQFDRLSVAAVDSLTVPEALKED